MARATIFKGVIHVDEVRVPVRLHSAVRRERVRFRRLHDEDHERLEQRMYCSAEDEPVEPDERARGFEVIKGQYVVLDPDRIREVQPETDRRMEIRHFVDAGEIDPRLYDRPYYLGPDGDDNRYALLARALGETGRVGVCQWTMRRRHYVGIIRPVDKLLLLITLRYAHELVAADEFEIRHPRVKDKELKSARDLVDELSASFDPSDYRNEHQQRLMYFIEQKAKGKKPGTEPPKRRKPTRPSELQAALEKSLEEARAH